MEIKNHKYEQAINNYQQISEKELESDANQEIQNNLWSLYYISMNLPAQSVPDFFSGESFSIIESFEELSNSYELIKFGFFKQSMVSLRIGFEIGLLSIYWSIVGKENSEFKKWYHSKQDTPYKNKKFWNIFLSNNNILEFDKRYYLINKIKEFKLSDYVHTKGIWFSNFGNSHRDLKTQGKFDEFNHWFEYFKEIVEILTLLHLLKFPALNLRYTTEFLISKFATTDSIPQCGCGLGDEMNIIDLCISEEQRKFIHELVKDDEEIVYIKKWLRNLPTLSESDIKKKIVEECKRRIEHEGGFENWKKNQINFGDKRIDSNMKNDLKKWAQKKDLMTRESVIAKMKKRI